MQPRVYIDSALVFNVIKHEPKLWPDSLKVLLAAERGDIQLIASTLLLVEVSGYKGDVDLDKQDAVLTRYMEGLDIEWVELDPFVAREARALARRYKLRGADAAHLATAVRREADYL